MKWIPLNKYLFTHNNPVDIFKLTGSFFAEKNPVGKILYKSSSLQNVLISECLNRIPNQFKDSNINHHFVEPFKLFKLNCLQFLFMNQKSHPNESKHTNSARVRTLICVILYAKRVPHIKYSITGM